MAQITEAQLMRAQEAFHAKMKAEHAQKGTMTCSCHVCNCPQRKELLVNKMHVFFHPDGSKIDAVCDEGLRTLCIVYNIDLNQKR
ncbi:hypothetical protein [Runella sp.]|uniref:hypothetical protein n=1 Tax=Runella sp. TaxID=1960881 RepID=UPI003D0B7D09